jgi:hypothetical protein
MPLAATMRPQHGHGFDMGGWRGLLQEFAESRRFGGGNVDKEERRRVLGQRRHELPPQIAVDLSDGHEHGEAEAERHHHRGVNAPGRECWR